jgi:acyl carrier protein
MSGGLAESEETAMDAPAIEREIRAFLGETFPLAGDPGSVPADGSLIELGVIDSTGVLEIVGFIESRFGFEIPIEEIAPEYLDTIHSITAYVGTRLREGGGG